MLQVKIFDESHEKDLERSVNNFLMSNNYDIIDVQFRTAVSIFSEEQVYCFSAMILYKIKEASIGKKLCISLVIGGLVFIILTTDLYDNFTYSLLIFAESKGMSSRVVLFLRRDFEVVSLDSNRLDLQNQLISAIIKKPLGYGLTGDFSIIGGYSHNLIIEIIVEYGIIIGGFLIIGLMKILISSLHFTKEWNERSIIWLFISNVIVMLFISGTYLACPEFFFLIGICVSLKRINLDELMKGDKNGIINTDNQL